jgi:diguanylate cyclase (GGDEF)-like protein
MRLGVFGVGVLVGVALGNCVAAALTVKEFDERLEVMRTSGQLDAAEAFLDSTVVQAQTSHEPLLEAAAHLAKAEWIRTTDPKGFDQERSEAAVILSGVPDAALLRRLHLTDLQSLDDGHLNLQAVKDGEALADEAMGIGDWRLEIDVLLELAHAGHNPIRLGVMSPYALRAYELAERHRGERQSIEAEIQWANWLSEGGRVDEAMHLLDRTLGDARAAANVPAQVILLISMGLVQGQAHNFDMASEKTQAAIDLATASRFPERYVAMLLVNQSDLFLRAERYPEALESANKAVVAAKNLPTALWVARFNRAIALNHLGKRAEALALMEQLCQGDDRAPSLRDLAKQYAVAGNYERAYRYLLEYQDWRQKLASNDQGDSLTLISLNERLVAERRLRIEGEHRAAMRTSATVVVVVGILASIAVGALWLTRRHNRALGDLNRQLHEHAMTDSLTGLKNRRHFGNQIGAHIAASDRAHGLSGDRRPPSADILFFLIDLDYFKQVNDLHGHPAGDAVLVQAALRLQSVMRAEDELIRWGGEEFLLVTRGTSRENAVAVAERIRCSIASVPFTLANGVELQKSCSVGFAPYPLVPGGGSEFGWESVIELADQALFIAKTEGRNRWIGVVEAVQPPTDISQGVLARCARAGTIRLAALEPFGTRPDFGTDTLDAAVSKTHL